MRLPVRIVLTVVSVAIFAIFINIILSANDFVPGELLMTWSLVPLALIFLCMAIHQPAKKTFLNVLIFANLFTGLLSFGMYLASNSMVTAGFGIATFASFLLLIIERIKQSGVFTLLKSDKT